MTEGCLNRTPTLPSLLTPSTTMLGGIADDGVSFFLQSSRASSSATAASSMRAEQPAMSASGTASVTITSAS